MNINIESCIVEDKITGFPKEVNYIKISEGNATIKLPIDNSYSHNELMEEVKNFYNKLTSNVEIKISIAKE